MDDSRNRHYKVLLRLAGLPEKMVVSHDHENLAEFILHEVSASSCLQLGRAAFFVDNPDFDCLKGVAGISENERFSKDNVWDKRPDFTEHMREAPFNKAVRSVMRNSTSRKGSSWQECAEDVARSIAVEEPGWHVFSLRHGNTGLLLFEPNVIDNDTHELLAAAVSLLALCPVF